MAIKHSIAEAKTCRRWWREGKERVRLYTRGTILGYKRSKSNQYPNTSLLQIKGVNSKNEVSWYQGKGLAYIYKAKVKKSECYYRCIWDKVARPHGNSDITRAKFKPNLPPKSMGDRVKVFMYPSNIWAWRTRLKQVFATWRDLYFYYILWAKIEAFYVYELSHFLLFR